MYEVNIHWRGRPIIRNGPMAGCPDFERSKWMRITPRPVGLARAKALADAQVQHATVTEWMASTPVYDNGKEPGVLQ